MSKIKRILSKLNELGATEGIIKAIGLAFASWKIGKGVLSGISKVGSAISKVKGGIGAILVIAEERDDTYDIVDWKAVVVDGEVVKADTWYRLENGELVEVD